ncbi:uncharacterized protein At5g01610-like [Rutidosis leptorrhynchoides]|uniref:uncharacterized protein At5g01610-like n=1 Tax=Rutidosis leptorrhynchoides TaxID=125765 RepID=UPI003A993239
MASQLIANNKSGAEIYNGASACTQKVHELLQKSKLPKGLLAVKEITEFGYNPTTGFFWIKQAKKSEHKFRALNKLASYDTEVVGFIEEGKMTKISGFKVKAMMVWFSVTDISIDEKDSEKLSFLSAGIAKSFPASAFELQE